ncbi:MAG: class I tRNA ligase family protein, partial [Patescibacteria group bacterium]
RFGNRLSEARDGAISRSRFWGAPIPVWKEGGKENGEKYYVIGSVEDLKKYSKAKNTYYVMRHGEAENNVKRILDARTDTAFHLTEKGKEQIKSAASDFKNTHIDIILVSPITRTRETAEIVRQTLNLSSDAVIIEEHIREYDTGVFDGYAIVELSEACDGQDRFGWRPEGGENYLDIKKRMGDFLYDIEKKYFGKSILIITHETPAMLLFLAALGLKSNDILKLRPKGDFMANAEIRKLDFSPIPHNAEYELDLHRPFIDEIELRTLEGNKLIRVPDVFDCWFESGSMPYGEAHYPFNKSVSGEGCEGFEPESGIFKKSKGFPADFIAEGLDQTRGWFYSMLVLGVALFGKSPYRKVIVNGLVLSEDGQKMSKSRKNYPDPMNIVEKYGADSLRFYLVASSVVRAQDLCFSEKGVDEVTKKVVNRLLNVLTFYKMYAGTASAVSLGREQSPEEAIAERGRAVPARSDTVLVSSNILDCWIISRLNETIKLVTDGLEAGELDKVSRLIVDFIDDLSTWYLRRSRDRFKEEEKNKEEALATTRYVLLTLAKIMAPFTPFFAEHVYKEVGGEKESVHLEDWPEAGRFDIKNLKNMKIVRDISSKGLEARMLAKINVRQPLKELRIKNDELGIKNALELIKLIKDEVNVKEVIFDSSIEKEVELELTMTPELKEEGEVRELLRKIQDLRKEKGLVVGDMAILVVMNNLRDLVSRNMEMLKKNTNLKNIEFGDKFELKL